MSGEFTYRGALPYDPRDANAYRSLQYSEPSRPELPPAEAKLRPTVYLAGHIFAGSYRQAATTYLDAFGFDILDPIALRDFRGNEDDHVVEIVHGDLEDIRSATLVLANFTVQSAGTSMECWFAHSIGRPVYSFTEGIQRVSPWIQYVSEHVDISLADALTRLSDYNVVPE